MLRQLGELPIDQITTAQLVELSSAEVDRKERSVNTGRHCVDAVSAVLDKAIDRPSHA